MPVRSCARRSGDSRSSEERRSQITIKFKKSILCAEFIRVSISILPFQKRCSGSSFNSVWNDYRDRLFGHFNVCFFYSSANTSRLREEAKKNALIANPEVFAEEDLSTFSLDMGGLGGGGGAPVP